MVDCDRKGAGSGFGLGVQRNGDRFRMGWQGFQRKHCQTSSKALSDGNQGGVSAQANDLVS